MPDLQRFHSCISKKVLPYHTLVVFKWKNPGIPYPLEGIKPPSKERVENAEKILDL